MIKLTVTTFLVALCLFGFSASVPVTSAAPAAQASPSPPTPTDEPPKPPYVFPTPIYIPTYPGDTATQPTSAPGSASPSGATSYTVLSGDSPWTISQKVYGDGSKYRLIMSANSLTDSTRLRVGAVLTIPPLGSSAPGAGPSLTPAAAAAGAPSATTVPATPAAPSTAEPSVQPSETPAAPSGFDGSTAVRLASAVVNVGSAILVLAALLSATLAVFAYIRARRMQMLNMRKIRLMIRQ
ncbi:MAG: LysM peptidoglycan-binding domain-containing protein [Chloroflexi bacterium]|nr:LysM peptidoglycan-binding domain-containing protein [Chloroflexota bacterium]